MEVDINNFNVPLHTHCPARDVRRGQYANLSDNLSSLGSVDRRQGTDQTDLQPKHTVSWKDKIIINKKGNDAK